MTPVRILGICGSLQAASSNLALLEAVTHAASAAADIVVVPFDGIRALPLFDPDLETAGPIDAVVRWRAALADADAIVIASPEYGHSLPGALKNAIDWVIGSGELNTKVVAITASVRSPDRGRLGLQALRQTLEAVDAAIVWDAPIVQGDGAASDVAALLRAVRARSRNESP